jgi:2-hydroxyglutarate dehydrogenase
VAVERIECAVIGAGVIGLAVARELALRGREVIVIESENAIGTGTSSRNSEVIHAGIYYETVRSGCINIVKNAEFRFKIAGK